MDYVRDYKKTVHSMAVGVDDKVYSEGSHLHDESSSETRSISHRSCGDTENGDRSVKSFEIDRAVSMIVVKKQSGRFNNMYCRFS